MFKSKTKIEVLQQESANIINIFAKMKTDLVDVNLKASEEESNRLKMIENLQKELESIKTLVEQNNNNVINKLHAFLDN